MLSSGTRKARWTRTRLGVLMVTVAMLPLFVAALAQAQTYTILHNFTGADGAGPYAGITFDQRGRIYGTTTVGGSHQEGLVYRLIHEGEGWLLSPIYSFGSQANDGQAPYARVVFGPDGLLYGTTSSGGAFGAGTVFSLRPPATACTTALCPWVETILYSFTGGSDGAYPQFGDLIFDQANNIYGTTLKGGNPGAGVVFKLVRSDSGWTESVLWNFTGGNDGAFPYGGVIFDNAGNLYGTDFGGSDGFGVVYELSPTQSGWNETTLHTFGAEGNGAGGLIMDGQANLFGITGGFESGFYGGNVAAYELAPQNGNWSFTLLHNFGGEFPTPVAAPTIDSQGNLYGPLAGGGSLQDGELFKLVLSGNQWIYSSLFQFDGSDGRAPFGPVVFDSNGNMYGTTYIGGTNDGGTVWELTP